LNKSQQHNPQPNPTNHPQDLTYLNRIQRRTSYLNCLGVRSVDDYWRLIARLRKSGGRCKGIGG
jgi:hypothetical protein